MKTSTENKILWTLMDIERAYTSTPYASAVFAAFVLYLAHEHPDKTELKSILVVNEVSKPLARVIEERLSNHWDKYRPLLTAFPKDDLADLLSTVDGERLAGGKGPFASSLPVADLVSCLLDLKTGDSVCDLGCATGDFIRKAYFQTFTDDDANKLVGIDHSSEAAAIAEIRMRCIDANVSILNESMFSREFRDARFDKVFCDPPLAARGLAQNPEVRAFLREAFPDFPELTPSMQGEWLFAARAVAAMKKGGRAVVVMAPTAMSDMRHARYRRYFVQHGLVEAVIDLPPRLYTHTNVGPCLVVFSEGNEAVRMINAAELRYANRKTNVLGKGHIDTIAACLGLAATCDPQGLDKYCKSVGREELLDNDCDLSVRRCFAPPVPVRDGVPLGSLLADSGRGATIPAEKLDKLVTSEDTPFLYVTPGQLDDGTARPLHLREMPVPYRPRCAKDGDIVVARVLSDGSEIKSAVLEIPDGKTVLPSDNLQILSVDRARVDPYFIKACLDNGYAQRFLASFSGGSVIRHLTPRDLERLPIPALPLSRQREIGEACRAAVHRVHSLREQLDEARRILGCVLSDNEPACLAATEGEA